MKQQQQMVSVALTAKEWQLISTLRGIPSSPLRRRVDALLDDLVDFIKEPRCPEMQADGVPCENVHSNCDQCAHAGDMIDSLAIDSYLCKKAGPE